MNEKTHRRFDALVRTLGLIGAVTVFFVGVQRYAEERREHRLQERELRERELAQELLIRDRQIQMGLWQERIQAIRDIAVAAATVASAAPGDEAFKTASRSLEGLYASASVFWPDAADLLEAIWFLRYEIRRVRANFEPDEGDPALLRLQRAAVIVEKRCRPLVESSRRELLRIRPSREEIDEGSLRPALPPAQ